MPEGKYSGRLATDGTGNLLADEGDFKGWPVAYDEGMYIYIQPGEPSHNERFHQNAVEFSGTVSADMVAEGDEDLINAQEGGENAHHFEVPDPSSPAPVNPDAMAATASSHTDAYTSNGAA
jgi:hypothetical protein